jgi:hypothetical protein
MGAINHLARRSELRIGEYTAAWMVIDRCVLRSQYPVTAGRPSWSGKVRCLSQARLVEIEVVF